MNLRSRFFVTLLACAIIPLLGTMIYINQVMTTSVEQKTAEQLQSVAKIKQSQMAKHLEKIKNDLTALSINDAIVAFSDGDASKKDEALHLLRNYQETEWGKLHHVFLVSPEAKVVLSPPHGNSTGSHMGHDIHHPAFKDAAAGKKVITDFYGFSEKNHYHQLLMVPVNVKGAVGGVIVAEITIAYQNDMLAENFELGETGKIYMSSLSGELIVNDKDKKQPPAMSSELQKAIDDGMFVGERPLGDTDIFAVYLHDESYPWIMCVEMSVEEMFADVTKVTVVIISLAVLALAVLIPLAWWIANSISRPIVLAAEVSSEVSKGHIVLSLSKKLMSKGSSELSELHLSIAAMLNNLHKLITGVQASSTKVQQTSQDLMSASKNLLLSNENMEESSVSFMESVVGLNENIQGVASAAHQIDTSIDQIKSTSKEVNEEMLQITEQVRVIAEQSAKVKKSSEDSDRVSDDAKLVVAESSQTMSTLGGSAQEIGVVLESIKKIAEQTNLLALNATIEAASAGEAGKGFTVVASEIKELARQSALAAEDIQEKIENIQQQTQSAIASTERLDQAMEQINEASKEVRASVTEQSDSIVEIQGIVEKTQRNVQSLDQSMEEAATGINDISQQSTGVASTSTKVTQDLDELKQNISVSRKVSTLVSEKSLELQQMAEEEAASVGQFHLEE